jgi:hypothetical protein
MKRLWCKLGIHRWWYYELSDYEGVLECLRCGKKDKVGYE